MHSNFGCFCVSPCGSGTDFIKRLMAEKDVTPEDSVSRPEHETMREQLEGEVNHLTQLLQGALRKQDEMALEAADAWQKVRRKRSQEGKSKAGEKNWILIIFIHITKSIYFLIVTWEPFYPFIRRGRIVQSGKPCRSWWCQERRRTRRCPPGWLSPRMLCVSSNSWWRTTLPPREKRTRGSVVIGWPVQKYHHYCSTVVVFKPH